MSGDPLYFCYGCGDILSLWNVPLGGMNDDAVLQYHLDEFLGLYNDGAAQHTELFEWNPNEKVVNNEKGILASQSLGFV